MNDRLKEISDYVDMVMIENKVIEDVVEEKVIEDVVEEKVIEYEVVKVNKVIEDKFVRLMRKIETRIYFKYKNNCNPDNFTMKTLYFGFIYALFRMSGYSEEMKKLANDNIGYFNEIDDFILDTYGGNVRKYVKNMMKGYNIKPIIEDIEIKEVDNEVLITDELMSIIKKEPNRKYPIEKLMLYKNKVIGLRKSINDLCEKLIVYLDNKEYDMICFLNDSIDIREYKIRIIRGLVFRLNKMIKCISRFNMPELMIYNKLVEIKMENDNILYILNNYKLPVSRNYKNINNLTADFLILTECNKSVRFSVIEYDGPSHYNTKYYMFKDSIVYCDIVKNNFCRLNSINILRVRDTDKIFLNNIVKFIESILVSKNIVIIPEYEEYIKLIKNVS
jgi:hypothetical protein